MRHGRSVDTTMGLTPLDGLMMGTRSGAIDPGVLLYLQQRGMSLDDLRTLYIRNPDCSASPVFPPTCARCSPATILRAAEAIELFTFRVAKEVAAMANTLGGYRMPGFTGGIGEHSAEIRQTNMRTVAMARCADRRFCKRSREREIST